MPDQEADDRLQVLLKAGYAAPPPGAAFVQSLGERLERETAKLPPLAHPIMLASVNRVVRRRFFPPAVAASIILAVTLTLLALRPATPSAVSPEAATLAQLGRSQPDPRSPVHYGFVQPDIRAGVDPLTHAGQLGIPPEKLGDTPQAASFWYQQPNDAYHLFFAKPASPRSFATQLGRKPGPKLKEPEHQAQSPRYCLLVFGPKAETRVWLVLDLVSEPYDPKGNRDLLYVDRNGNGDLTEPGEQVTAVMREHKYIPYVSFAGYVPKEVTQYIPTFRIGEVIERDGKTKHTDVTVEVGTYVGQLRTCKVSAKVNGKEERAARDYLLRFSKRLEDAPVIHFNGPLAMNLSMETGAIHVPVNYEGGEWDPPRREAKHLDRGKETELYAEVGTPGLGAGSFLPVTANIPPKDAHPVAEVEFPHRDPKQPAIKVRVVLKGRC